MKAAITEIGLMAIMANVVDNITTYVALTAETPGYEVWEANPVAQAGFDLVGLAPFLAAEFFLVTGVLLWVIYSKRLSDWAKLAILFACLVSGAVAAANNLSALVEMGII